jgi:hypothetical protein
MTCLIVSVEITVDIPSLLPNKEASVLFPVPDVPASNTRIFLFDSKLKVKSLFLVVCYSYTQDQKRYKNLSNILALNIYISPNACS